MRALSIFSLCFAVGCTAVLDVDRFKETDRKDPGPLAATSPFSDLDLSLVTMKPHLAHMFEYRVVDANNFVQSRGVIDSLVAEDATLHIPKAIPKLGGPYHLDFYADVNASGGFDGLGSVVSNDHAWRIDPLADFPEGAVTHVDGLVQVVFVHSTTFTNIDQYPSGTPNKAKDTELPIRLNVSGVAAYMEKMLQIRVADKGTGHVVGLYRTTVLKREAFEATIPGAVDVGVEYTVSVYVDGNGNGAYDDPSKEGGDKGWKLDLTSDAQGLAVSFDGNSEGGAVDVGKP